MDAKEKLSQTLKRILSEQLGIEPDDIQNDFSLTEDLHMGPTEITDFTENLAANGIDAGDLDMEETTTFDDLVEALSLSQL